MSPVVPLPGRPAEWPLLQLPGQLPLPPPWWVNNPKLSNSSTKCSTLRGHIEKLNVPFVKLESHVWPQTPVASLSSSIKDTMVRNIWRIWESSVCTTNMVTEEWQAGCTGGMHMHKQQNLMIKNIRLLVCFSCFFRRFTRAETFL